jgi:hypothetical protein
MFTEPGSAREEAERLIAAALAAATLAANANPHWSTGSAECCVCPLCKVIAAVRDPDPQFVERLATGAGDLAAGLTSFLRNIAPPDRAGDPWRQATDEAAGPAGSADEQPPAAAGAEKPGDDPADGTNDPSQEVSPQVTRPARPMAKKSVRPTAGQRPVNTVFQTPPPESDLDL